MIILNNICKEFADKKLFENLNLTIYDGEKIGIIGDNGTGKTTLFNLIAKEISPDSGHVSLDGEIEYVKQSGLNKTNNEEMTISEKINFNKNFSELKLKEGLNSQDKNTYSGGERTKVALLNAFKNENASVILLDEPTNHLDENGIKWLIDKINNFWGTLIVISHDRYFLNQIANKIIELDNGKVYEYYGNYDDFLTQKNEKLEYAKKQYELQKIINEKIENEIKDLKQKAKTFDKNSRRDGSSDKRSKGFKGGMSNKAGKISRQVKAKETRLEQQKQKNIKVPPKEKEIFYSINSIAFGSKLLIKAENLSKKFNENLLFENVNFCVESGDKIALTGDNGSGKTTLLKMILGQENFEGNLWISNSVKIAYLSQDVFDIDDDISIIEFASKNGFEYKTKFLTNLANMGLNKQIFNKKINTLSLGEKMKIKINEIILSDFNLLLLDEPTNHLDINNKIFLEKVLKNYKGNLIVVSHDKSFVNNVATKILKIKNKKISLI